MASEEKYPNVYKLLSQGDDVTMQDIITDMHSAGLTEADLPIMEAALSVRPEYIQELPFPGDDKAYDSLLETNTGFQLLQKFMDFWG